jgi:hypothetical protein
MKSKYLTLRGCTVFERGLISWCVRADIWHVEDEWFLYLAYCKMQHNKTLVSWFPLRVENHLQNTCISCQVAFSCQTPNIQKILRRVGLRSDCFIPASAGMQIIRWTLSEWDACRMIRRTVRWKIILATRYRISCRSWVIQSKPLISLSFRSLKAFTFQVHPRHIDWANLSASEHTNSRVKKSKWFPYKAIARNKNRWLDKLGQS